ncbi:putative phage related protein [Escherichia coli]|uniref:Putative phage related protein n=1 Tax=Escherichia coli TaxID=562 RepID=A0A377AMX1_ECOLX|nr:putative phage related protein [Escherichia coli]
MTECMIYRMRFVLSVPSRRRGRLAVLIPVPHSCVVTTAAPILSLILTPGKLKLSLRVVLMWLPLWLIFLRKVTIHGLLTWMGGMVGSVVSGVASKITGAVEFLGER